MRLQDLPGIDDRTVVAGIAPWWGQLAALTPAVEGGAAPSAVLPGALVSSPAVNELLDLIQQSMGEAPPVDLSDQGGPTGELSAVLIALGPGDPDFVPPPDPAYEIVPLGGTAVVPLSLNDQDLFGESVSVSPLGGQGDGAPSLFQGFQIDLFGSDAASPPSLEVGIDNTPPILVPPTLSAGLVTMFEGTSQLQLTPDLALSLTDENGRLVIEGDGDDVVLLTADWHIVDQPLEEGGFTYYVDSNSGLAVGIRGADVIFV